MHEYRADIAIIGGGLGGCAAALAATASGKRVILTEETDWIGGQSTSQLVPMDEHRWIEKFGCTRRYRQFREVIRRIYREHYPLSAAARQDPQLNPGRGSVSRVCCEPRVALLALEQMLLHAISKGDLLLLLRRRAKAADIERDSVRGVTLLNLEDGQEEVIRAEYFLDATELGDLLPLAKVEYVSGTESQSDTGEPHAPAEARPDNVQALTWCFIMGFDPRGEHVIQKPARYDFWHSYVPPLKPAWPGRMLDWAYSHPITLKSQLGGLWPSTSSVRDLWTYRQVVCKENYAPEQAPLAATVVNWPHNDYLTNIIDQPAQQVERALEESRQMSLSLLYWMQTEAPRPDGGRGYPGLFPRPDLTGAPDGLAKAPYIRESRRIKAVFRVTEQHVGVEARKGREGCEPFTDSVGVGCYRIDLHPSTGGDNYIDVSAWPFQIPLGALLPVRMKNLLPACKNIGTTHITNGCYRLHPVEWNIGEAAGALAAFCLDHRCQPRQIRAEPERLKDFQTHLSANHGVELEWPRITTV